VRIEADRLRQIEQLDNIDPPLAAFYVRDKRLMPR
jgi:hypothetical protein